jgi:hypothetical protein
MKIQIGKKYYDDLGLVVEIDGTTEYKNLIMFKGAFVESNKTSLYNKNGFSVYGDSDLVSEVCNENS